MHIIVLQKSELNDEDFVFYLNKSKRLPISLTLIKNDFSLLNNILNNELPINVFDIWTNDNGPDLIGTGNKTYLRRPMITRSKFCEIFLPLYQLLLTNKKKKYRKKYLSGGHRVSGLL